ncbi:hypothetical protein V5799_023680 [Amblyomma americanum]|uniref:U2A'/phosphoprotein 32 family A C-terminal domain-containing protein n=1 Tax=Amblyomma americanum TaxID=6943 RepID=A0AAQ4FIB0_AMBAM
MSVLTENCVLSRTRAQDLKSVRKLNCWGSELEDVSIVRKMSHVEVLSLSVNNISTLADFAHCKNLQELYIRKNNIQDLNEVLYLKDLPKLKNLWLADNPCAENENYRMTVLRHLPSLQKLDNQTVQSHEVERAQVQGAVLILPTLGATGATEEESPPAAPVGNHNRQHPSSQPPSRHSPPQTHQNGSEDVHHKYSNASRPRDLEVDVPAIEASVPNRPAAFQSPAVNNTPCKEPPRLAEAACSPVLPNMPQDSHVSCQGMSPAEQHAFHARVQTLMDHSGRRLRKSAEITCDPVALFEGDDPVAARQSSAQLGDTRRFSSVEYLHTHSSLESDALMSPPPGDGNVRGCAAMYAEVHRSHKAEKGSPTRLLPKGGKNRNANILSAVLCLIKELDYASLEVVETAIHCRMEEMDGMVKSAPFEGRRKTDKIANSDSDCGSGSILDDFFEAVGNVLRVFS